MFSWNIVLYPLSQFATKSQNDQNYHIAKKHSASKPDYTSKCNRCSQEFPGFYANINIETLNTESKRIKNKRCGCGTNSVRFWGSEIERRNVFLSTFLAGFWAWKGETESIQLPTENSQRKKRGQETWFFFNNIKCATKVNLAFKFILKNKEDGGFRYFYATENNTLLDRSKLVSPWTICQNKKTFLTKLTTARNVVEKKWAQSGTSTS